MEKITKKLCQVYVTQDLRVFSMDTWMFIILVISATIIIYKFFSYLEMKNSNETYVDLRLKRDRKKNPYEFKLFVSFLVGFLLGLFYCHFFIH